MPSFEVKANQVFAKPHKNFFSSQMSFSKNAVHQKLDQGTLGMSDPSQVNLHQGHQGHQGHQAIRTTRAIRATKNNKKMMKTMENNEKL